MNMQAEGLPQLFPETSQSLKKAFSLRLLKSEHLGRCPQAIDEKGLQP